MGWLNKTVDENCHRMSHSSETIKGEMKELNNKGKQITEPLQRGKCKKYDKLTATPDRVAFTSELRVLTVWLQAKNFLWEQFTHEHVRRVLYPAFPRPVPRVQPVRPTASRCRARPVASVHPDSLIHPGPGRRLIVDQSSSDSMQSILRMSHRPSLSEQRAQGRVWAGDLTRALTSVLQQAPQEALPTVVGPIGVQAAGGGTKLCLSMASNTHPAVPSPPQTGTLK